VAPAAAGIGLALLLTGCGSGQITQTDTQVAAVNGASGTVGAMAVRGAELAFPSNSAQGVYAPGSSAPLIVTIVNTGVTPDTLTGVSTPAAESVTVDGSPTGTRPIAGGFAIISGRDVDDSDTTGVLTPLTQAPSTSTPAGQGAGQTSGSTPETSAQESPSGAQAGEGGGGKAVPSTTVAPALAPAKVEIVLTGIKTYNGAPLRSGLTIPITFTFAHAGRVTVEVPIAAPADNYTPASSADSGS
jgi:copper(I)-binding protein